MTIYSILLACVLAVGHNPTPEVTWQHSLEFVDGFNVYYTSDGTWTLAAVLPCYYDRPFGTAPYRWRRVCRTWSAPQRYVDLPRAVDISFYVTAYNSYGESRPSEVVSTCWPELWTFDDFGNRTVN